MIAIDTTSLSLLINPSANAPLDPNTGNVVTRIKERFDFFQAKLVKEQETLLIPTPVLSELLILSRDNASLVLERLHKSSRFKIAPFDERAAIELAIIHRDAVAAGDKKGGSSESWVKIKFDRQIIAVAKVNGADTIYSDDKNLSNFAKLAGLDVVRVWEMELPPQSDQIELTFPSDEPEL